MHNVRNILRHLDNYHASHARPWKRGFSRSFGLSAGAVYQNNKQGSSVGAASRFFMDGASFDQSNDPRLPEPAAGSNKSKDNWYSTDLFTHFGLDFIRENDARNPKQPFFLFLAHVAPHHPLQAAADDIARFRGSYSAGWNSTAEHRLANQQAIGLEHNAFSVNAVPENQNLQMLLLQLESVSDTNNSSANASSAFASAATIDSVASALAAIDGDDHLMSVYAAVHHRLDNAVGDFVAGLKALGKFESTLILFLSDNGGSSEGGMHGERTGDDPTLPESKWRLGQGWATVANAPFKGHKASVYEGGIATPFIAHWPEGIKRRGGSWEHAPAHVIDILPTLLDIVSGKGTMLYLTDILFTRGP